MKKLPRDLSGDDLSRALKVLGYRVTRHSSLRAGTVAAILEEVAVHFNISRLELQERLFG